MKTFENAQNQKKESVYERLRNLQRESFDRQSEQIIKSRDRGAR